MQNSLQNALDEEHETECKQGLRGLQQAAEAAEVTAVFTEEDLLNAMATGAPHIVIRDNLDLTTVEPLASISMFRLRQDPDAAIGRTIRVSSLKTFAGCFWVLCSENKNRFLYMMSLV